MVKFKLSGNSLMVSNDEDDEKNLRDLIVLHNTTRQYSSGEVRRKAVQTEKITIKLVKNHYAETIVLTGSESNCKAARRMVNDVIATRDQNKLYVIMLKDKKEVIVCQLSFDKSGKPFWSVDRTSEFTYRELNYFTDVLSSANIYVFITK